MVFLTVLLFLLPNAVPPSLAKPRLNNLNCPSSCGNSSIDIPFPFGIGTGCFLDKWYEIDCRNGSSPFLTKIDLEVLDISLPSYNEIGTDGTIHVSFPVVYNERCAGGHLPVKLTGSNFFFSQKRNMFIAVGCDVLALMNSSTSGVFGCKSGCHSANTSSDSICPIGSGCCQTSIPLDIQDFEVEFKDDSGKEECAYAFLADQSWMASKNYSDLYSLGAGRQSVPAVLKWGISNPLSNNPGNNQRCTNSSFSSLNKTMPFFQCYCLSGYEGNGYLVNECQDIDECVSPPNNQPVCPGNLKCVNKPGRPDCVDSSKRVKLLLIGVGSALGALLLLWCVWRLRKFIKKRNEIKLRKKYFERNGGLLLLQQQFSSSEGSLGGSRIFTTNELEVATDNFNPSRVVGHGGQGTVYKGMLGDGRIVAIKKSVVVDEEKLVQFINEVVILSQINHRNIVKLLGCCLETEVPLLVYEFIPNGTLYQYLHDLNEVVPVTWETRLRIAAEISGALSYLHSAASIPIYHRDIKSTNILLDEKYLAKVADFGTSKSVSLERTHVTTLVKGTFGYLDPEYFQSSKFTDKSDVYSFGVVLVELLTGQKPISLARTEDEEDTSLATYFIITMEESELFEILHPQVKEQGSEEEISRVAHLARRCLHLHGRNRPTMKEVATELEEVRNIRFPCGIHLGAKGSNGIIKEQHADCIAAPGGSSSPNSLMLTSSSVTMSW